MVVSINGGSPKWRIFFMENPMKVDENQGYSHFRKTPQNIPCFSCVWWQIHFLLAKALLMNWWQNTPILIINDTFQGSSYSHIMLLVHRGHHEVNMSSSCFMYTLNAHVDTYSHAKSSFASCFITVLVVPSGPWSARTAGIARLPVTARLCPFRSLYAVFRARQLEVVHVS